MSLQTEFYARLADEGISLYALSTADMRKVNEIIAELLNGYKSKEDE
jgi:hypothetical protein